MSAGRGRWAGTLGGKIFSTLILTVTVLSFISHKTLAQWTPLMAIGLVAASLVQAVFKSRPTPHTDKLFHDPKYRSIFRGDRLSSRLHSDNQTNN